MNISDVDSIVYLLQSISFWGIAFIVLIILPLYIIGWSAIFKLLNINAKQSITFVIIIMISIIVSLTLLKVGINKDQELIVKATQLKNLMVKDNYPYKSLNDSLQIVDKNKYNYRIITKYFPIEDLVDRFPNSFSYGWGEKNESFILLIDSVSLRQIERNINKLVPLLYTQLKYILKKDEEMSFNYIVDRIDTRMNYNVLEALICKYPSEFVEIGRIDSTSRYEAFIQRIK
jgi:hypothetical protein